MRKSIGGGLPKLALGLFVALVVLLGFAPGLGLREALADDVSVLGNGVNSPSAKMVMLGGKRWQVVGYKGTGVAQSPNANMPTQNTATLLLESNEIPQEDTKFSKSSSSNYGGSILQEKMTALYNTFSADEKSVIAARDLLGGGRYDANNTQNFVDRVYDDSGVSGQHLWPLSSHESIKELDRAIRWALCDWWLRSPGNSYDRVAYYDFMRDGVSDSGQEADQAESFVRPACYVNLDAVASVTRNENGTYTLNPKPPHTHNFSYSVSQTGETVTAACNSQDCPITEGLSLSINAPANTTYDGTAKAATLSAGYNTTAFPGTYSIVYKQGDTTLPGAPVNVGDYAAYVTVGEGNNAVTAKVDYSITKAPVPDTQDVQAVMLVGQSDTYNIAQSVAGVMPSDAGNPRYEKAANQPSQTGDTFTVSDFVVNASGDVTATVTYGQGQYAGANDSVTLPVKITSDNYADTTVNVVVRLSVKADAGVTLSDVPSGNKTYYGDVFTVTANVTNSGTGEAMWRWYSSDESVLKVTGSVPTDNGSKATVKVLKPGSAMIAAVYETEGTTNGSGTTGAVIGAAVTNAITVAKRPLTIKAHDLNSIYANPQQQMPSLKNEYTIGPNADNVGGLANEETLSALTLAYSPEATNAAPGTYAIVPSGATVSNGQEDVTANYDITYQNGSLTVNPKLQQTITAADVAVTYGQTATIGATTDATDADGGTISYSVMDGSKDYIDVDASSGALTVRKVPESGTAYVIVTAAGTEAYEEATKSVAVTVKKAPAPKITVEPVVQLVGSASTYAFSQSLAGVMPVDAGTLTYAKAGEPDPSSTSTFSVSDFAVSAEGVVSVKVAYTGEAGSNDQVTLPVKITSDNYEDTTVNVVVKPTPKTIKQVTLDPNPVPNKTYGDSNFDVTATVTDGSGNGEQTWTWYSSDESVLKVTGSVPTDNGSKATVQILKVGTAIIGALYEPADGNVIGAAVTNDVTVAKKTLTVAANNREIYVRGEVPDLANPVEGTNYTVTGLVGEDKLASPPTLSYQRNGQTVTPTSAETGTYDIVPSSAGAGDNYTITYQNGTLTIKPKQQQTIAAADVSVTFGDTDKSVSASVTNPADGGGAISYSVTDDSKDYIGVDASSGALTVKKVPESGKAYVTVTAAETGAYEETTKTVTVTINKAGATPATVTANDRAYDGVARPLVTVTSQAVGGTMQYSLDGNNFSEKVPTGTNVGGYDVKYKVAGDENHNDFVAQQPVHVTISKAPAPTIQPIQIVQNVGIDAEYNITQSVVGIMPTDAGNLTYTKAGEPQKQGADLNVNVETFGVENGSVTAKITYSGEARNEGTVTLPVTITSDNYADTTVNVVVKLTLKTIKTVTLDPNPVPDKTYGDSNFDVTASVDDAGAGTAANWQWYSSDESVLRVTGSVPTDNGSKATVQVLKPGSAIIAALYEPAGGTVIGAAMTEPITVNKRSLTITANGGIVRVGGEVPALPANPVKDTHYTVDGLVEGDSETVSTLSYQKDGAAVTPTSDAPGTYDIVPSGATVTQSDKDVTAYYAITYQNGKLEVKEKDTQTITAENVTVTFGDTGRNVDATTNGDGTLSYAVKPGSEAFVDVNASTGALTIKKAGTATVVVTATGTADYAEATKEVIVTINKANAVPATVAATNRIYDGTAKPLVTVTGQAVGGTMQYSTDGKNFSDRVPTGTDAGTYAVWYKVAGDENHNDTKPVRVTSTISKREDPKAVALSAKGHVQDAGDVGGRVSGNVATIGTTGQSKRLESFSLSLPAATDGGIEYRGHVQDKGWDSWVADGKACGTTGQSKRLEAMQMRLTGNLAKTHSVWYRVHVQDRGTLGWARDGQAAGTAGQALRLEQVEVCVLPKGQVPDGYVEGAASFVGGVSGRTHVQNVGWAAISGTAFGTTGRALRLEALSLNAPSLPEACGISYEAHVQDIGWQGARENGKVAGTEGQARRVEAVRVKLTGEAARSYSVWYRVHSQDFGWLGWAKDGADAGTTGRSLRAEAVDVQVLPAGQVPDGYDASRAACVTR